MMGLVLARGGLNGGRRKSQKRGEKHQASATHTRAARSSHTEGCSRAIVESEPHYDKQLLLIGQVRGRRDRRPIPATRVGSYHMRGMAPAGMGAVIGAGLLPAGGLVPRSAACWSEVKTLPASPTARMTARR